MYRGVGLRTTAILAVRRLWSFSMGRVERLFDGGNDLALDGERAAGDARAGGCRVAAAAELSGDVVHVHALAFRAQTHAGQLWFQFLKDTGDYHRRNGADMINEAFGIAAAGASAGEVGFL